MDSLNHDRMPRLSSFKKTSKTEGIVTELSRYRELFVIARNSSFQ
jgi:TolB-like protein